MDVPKELQIDETTRDKFMLGNTLRRRYKIIKELGSGGFGDTYLAEDLDLPGHPRCVVKHLSPKDRNPSILPIAQRLFDSEAKVLHALGASCFLYPMSRWNACRTMYSHILR